MILSKKHHEKLNELGMRLFDYGDWVAVEKPIGTGGNVIPTMHKETRVQMNMEGEVLNTFYSDCPSLRIGIKMKKWFVSCWDWVPGPGPGDFDKTFEDEEKAFEFLLHYFFEPNPYFEARKQYEHIQRDAINTTELQDIFTEILKLTEITFGKKDIPFTTRSFHKIEAEDWGIDTFSEEFHTIEVGTGILSYQAFMLKKKVANREALDHEDLRRLSDLLMELSMRVKANELMG